MHEPGHIASGLLDGRKYGGDYCWPSRQAPPPAASCGWTFGTAEWGAAAFEEAFVTVTADSTLWAPNAVEPTTCSTVGRCDHTADGNRIELTHYPFAINNCVLDTAAVAESRWPITGMRFLWDLYDDHNDCDGDTVGEGWSNYWRIYDNITSYPAGTGVDEADDPWNAARTAITEPNGRGSLMYKNRYNVAFGLSVNTLRISNCSPK